jgi:hypothetical protein
VLLRAYLVLAKFPQVVVGLLAQLPGAVGVGAIGDCCAVTGRQLRKLLLGLALRGTLGATFPGVAVVIVMSSPVSLTRVTRLPSTVAPGRSTGEGGMVN